MTPERVSTQRRFLTAVAVTVAVLSFAPVGAFTEQVVREWSMNEARAFQVVDPGSVAALAVLSEVDARTAEAATTRGPIQTREACAAALWDPWTAAARQVLSDDPLFAQQAGQWWADWSVGLVWCWRGEFGKAAHITVARDLLAVMVDRAGS